MTRLRMLQAQSPLVPSSGRAAQRAIVRQLRLSRLVLEQSELYVRALVAARKRQRRAAVHAVRVATRRLLAMRELLRFVDPDAGNGRLELYLGEPFRPCGQLRDLQVIQRRIRMLLPRFPEGKKFLRALGRQERKAKARAARALDEAHPRRIARLLASLASRLDELTTDRVGRDRAMRRVALRVRTANRAAKEARIRAKTGDPDLIHVARLALKSHRYMAELAKSLGVYFVSTEVESLSRLQATMGEITDRTMLLHALDSYRGKHPRAGSRLAHLRAFIERERGRLISRYLATDGRTSPAPRVAAIRTARPEVARARSRPPKTRRAAPLRPK